MLSPIPVRCIIMDIAELVTFRCLVTLVAEQPLVHRFNILCLCPDSAWDCCVDVDITDLRVRLAAGKFGNGCIRIPCTVLVSLPPGAMSPVTNFRVFVLTVSRWQRLNEHDATLSIMTLVDVV